MAPKLDVGVFSDPPYERKRDVNLFICSGWVNVTSFIFTTNIPLFNITIGCGQSLLLNPLLISANFSATLTL